MNNKFFIMTNNQVCFNINNKTYEIPSEMFYLSGEPIILTSQNTFLLSTQKIKNIFNKVEYKLGQCYTNSENLLNKLLKAKIKPEHIQYLVGWLFIDNGFPIHHALLLYQNKYVLDITPLMNGTDYFKKFTQERNQWKNSRDMRLSYAKWYQKFIKNPNTETATFGKMKDCCLFIGSVSSKEEGIQIWNELMKKYPNHPSNNNANNDGTTPLQSIIMKQ